MFCLLQGNLGTHPVFFMRDMSFKDLANIVEFMYRGKVNVAQSELGSFLKTAETLQVRGLTGDEEPAQSEVGACLLRFYSYRHCEILQKAHLFSLKSNVI